MNVEIGAEAALFPEKEYIYGSAVAVQAIRVHNMAESISGLRKSLKIPSLDSYRHICVAVCGRIQVLADSIEKKREGDMYKRRERLRSRRR
jgi:hypothetical protein